MSIFSVLMPVYNHARFVRQAVTSALRSALVSEIVLVDDGSTDISAAIVADLASRYPDRVRNLTKEGEGNRGAHIRLNQLVEAAKHEVVAVLNSDDVFVEGRFEAIVEHGSFPESDFAFGNLLLINAGGRLVGAKRGPFDTGTPFPPEFDVAKMVKSGNLVDLLAHQNYLGTTSNMVFTKELHGRIGGFRDFRYVHDWDFALRAMALGRCTYVRRFLTAYRMHETNTIGGAPTELYWESRTLFDRFLAGFPRLAERPLFRIGLERNVNLTEAKAARIATKPTRAASA